MARLHVRQFPLPERRCFAGRIGLEFRRHWTRGAETLSGFALSTANALKKLSLTTSGSIDALFLFPFRSFPFFFPSLFPSSRHEKHEGLHKSLWAGHPPPMTTGGGRGNLDILKLTPRGDYITCIFACWGGGGGICLALRRVSSYFQRISREWKRRLITLMRNPWVEEVTGARPMAAPETCGCGRACVAGGCGGPMGAGAAVCVVCGRPKSCGWRLGESG